MRAQFCTDVCIKGVEINLPPGYGPYCFQIQDQIYHLISLPYPNEVNKPECGRFYIFDSAEATTEQLENQSNQGCIAKVMQ
jgi:hypothetical protein